MAYSEDMIQRVWGKGIFVHYYSPRDWRQDECGAWIGRRHYGDHQSLYGWEIGRIKPESEGGGEELSNLRPLQWENSRSKKAGRLVCVVTSSGNDNVHTK